MITVRINNTEVRLSDNARFFESGAVRAGVLLDETTIAVGETEVTFAKARNKHDGIDYRDIDITWDVYDIYFYENGTLNAGSLSRDTTIPVAGTKIRFAAGDYLGILFHENGAIKSGHLAEQARLAVNGVPVVFRKDTRIYFYADGTVERGTLDADIVIDSISYTQGETLIRTPYGDVERGE